MGAWLEWVRAEAARHHFTDWGAFQLVALVASLAFFVHRTPGEQRKLRLCFLVAFAGAAVGSVALGVLLRAPAWVLSGFRLKVFSGGELMAYGALGGLVLTYAALARIRGVEPAVALDLAAPSLGILVFFARIGCFVAGCDFGAVTHVPWAVHYPSETAAFKHHLDGGLILPTDSVSLPVHPAQLYEAAVGLVMIAAALTAQRRHRRRHRGSSRGPAGSLFAATAIAYAAGRIFVELFRGDVRGALGPLSTPQWLSIAVIAMVLLRPVRDEAIEDRASA
jgi:phosphatidylglycerol:prolipoprotein diacylglycerol transferase